MIFPANPSHSTQSHISEGGGVEFAQIDTFLEHLRRMSEESEQDKEKAQSLQQRIQRESMRRQGSLHDSLFQKLSDEKEFEKRKELDTISEKKDWQRKELASSDYEKKWETRIETQKQDRNEQQNISPEQGLVSSDSMESSNMIGILQSAVVGDSQNQKGAESGVSQISGPTGPVFTSNRNDTVPTARTDSSLSVSENSGDSQTAQTFGIRLENGVAHQSQSNNQAQNTTDSGPLFPKQLHPELPQNPGLQNNEPMRLLASFSEMSGYLAGAVRNVQNQASVGVKPNLNSSSSSGSSGNDSTETDSGSDSITGSKGISEHSVQKSKQNPVRFADLLPVNNHRIDSPHSNSAPASTGQSEGAGANLQGAGSSDSNLSGMNQRDTDLGNSIQSGTSQNDSKQSGSGRGIAIDADLIDHSNRKYDRKPTPSFVSTLDQLFSAKNRRKSPIEEANQNDFQTQNRSTQAAQMQLSQLSQQQVSGQTVQRTAENASGKTNRDKPMLSQMDRVQLVQRVAGACQSAANQSGTIRIKLHPETLGSVSIKIQIKNKTLNANLETETESARDAILENIDQLKSRLSEQGIRIESFEIRVEKKGSIG